MLTGIRAQINESILPKRPITVAGDQNGEEDVVTPLTYPRLLGAITKEGDRVLEAQMKNGSLMATKGGDRESTQLTDIGDRV